MFAVLRHPLALLTLLALLGVVGNALGVSMFFGVDQIFGSIFVLLAVSLFGVWRGSLVAMVAHSYTIVQWGHPYAFIIFVVEALVVGLLMRRGVRSVFVADALFWIFIGAPAAWLFYSWVMGMSDTQATLIVLKQPANGLFNALIASLLMLLLPLRRLLHPETEPEPVAFRDLLLTLIMSFVFFSSFVTAISNSRQVLNDTLAMVTEDLNAAAEHWRNGFDEWRHRGAAQLAGAADHVRAGTPGSLPIRESNFALISWVDSDSGAVTTLFSSPEIDSGEVPLELIRRVCSPRVPSLSLDDRMFHQRLAINHGCIVGSNRLTALDALATRNRFKPQLHNSLVGPQEHVIGSSDPAHKLAHQPAQPTHVLDRRSANGATTYHLMSDDPTLPLMVRWKQSRYVTEIASAHDSNWSLRVTLLFSPYIDRLQRYYIDIFTIMLVVIGVVLAISILIQRRLSDTLSRLAQATYRLPERIRDGQPVEWPRSGVIELEGMTANVRHMADVLHGIFTESEERYRTLFDTTSDAILVYDMVSRRIVDANRHAETLLGRTHHELIDSPLTRLLRIEDAVALDELFHEAMAGKSTVSSELFLLHASGALIPVEVTPIAIRLRDREVLLGVFRDIRDKLQARDNLALVGKVFENTTEAIIITDADTRIIKINRAFCDITGYGEEEVIGRKPNLLSSGWHDQNFYREMWEEINTSGEWQGELWDRRKDGTPYAEWLSVSAIHNEQGEVTNYIGIFIDITEKKRAQERIHNLAFYDALTELPNRSLFMDRLAHAIKTAHRDQDRFALLFMDLDNFKKINDTLGHHIGDALLRHVATNVTALIRESDTFARLGGDEFTLILEHVKSPEDASVIADKIMERVTRPVELEGNEIVTTASVGICFYPSDGASSHELMQHADTAMYRAKEGGKNSFEFYTEEMNARAQERLFLEAGLRGALANDELQVYYQPQVAVADGRIIGAEALLRWNHPEKGFIPPGLFVPVAEESGLIGPIGDWVFERTALLLNELSGAGFDQLRLAVNVSHFQFRQRDFVEKMEALLARTGIDAQRLELELTERIIMDETEASEKLAALSRMGFYLSIDDFGTGYSSLSYLKRFSIDQLKIDKSFIDDVPGSAQSVEIVQAIATLAQALKMDVIAEGVETAEQLAFIGELGCDSYQGYHYSRPIPVAEFRTLLEERSA